MYIDTANSQEIKECLSLGIFKGVTTNPTLLLKEKTQRGLKIQELLNQSKGQLFVQTIGETAREMVMDSQLIKANDVNNRIILKIPINREGLIAIKELKIKLPTTELLGTAIYSSEQGIMAGKAGCDYVAPYVNRMLNNNIEPYQVIKEIKRYFVAQQIPCLIMGASYQSATQVMASFSAGVDTVTISSEIVQQMLEKEVANQAIAVFNQQGNELAKLKLEGN